jgi:tetratricopeptide (TPR) repeat protein
MSGFPALNIEPEDDNPEEVDDTREIQLEEALKLYQNALKLHSLGPDHLDQAALAYKELFNSDIFRYPEAISEFTRDELDDGAEDTPVADQSLPQLSLVQSANPQASPSSLPQIIYLSFKNYGQFLLQQHAQGNLRGSQNGSNTFPTHDLFRICSEALKQFAQALERDDTDLDLWRKAARVAQVCFSDRIVRFCLESVLAGDDDGTNEVVEILGLDEALAAGQLRRVIGNLQDDLSLAQISGSEPKKDLMRLLEKSIEPFSFLTPILASDNCHQQLTKCGYQPKRWVIRSTTRSWHGVGQSLLQALDDEQQFNSDPGPGAALYIDIPSAPESSGNDKVDGEPKLFRPTAIRGSEKIERENCPGNNAKAEEPEEQPSLDTALDHVVSPPQADALTAEEVCVGEHKADEGEEPSLPTRKRSAGSAGHDDGIDNARAKSKRLRNRESNVDAMLQDGDAASNLAKYHQDQLNDLNLADQWLFSTTSSLLSKLACEELGSLEDLRQDNLSASTVENSPEYEISAEATAVNDLRSALKSWSDVNANSVTHGYGGNTLGGSKPGLTFFLEHSKTVIPKSDGILPLPSDKGLSHFVAWCNEGWYGMLDVALRWLESLIRPNVSTNSGGNVDLDPSSYKATLWPEDLKFTVVQLIVSVDEYIYQVMQQRLDELAERMLSINGDSPTYLVQDLAQADMIQTLYELHLDVYSRITNPSSQVDNSTRVIQHDRLQRWSDLAGSYINVYADHADDVPMQHWDVIRFIWTATTHANMTDDTSREHVTSCLQDLRNLMDLAGNPAIILPNHAANPEISVSAVDQEISRISTLDFFMSVFNDNSKDPICVIESLEPILEPSNSLSMTPSHSSETEFDLFASIPSQTQQLINFLESGGASLKLFLWRRLREAYLAIDYSPKVVSCYLRSIEAIVLELSSRRHLCLTAQNRELSLLKWIKELDDMIAKVLHKVLANSQAFEIVDETHLRTSISVIARLSRILHGIAMYEDSVRVGQLPEPKGKNASGTKLLEKFRDRLRDMHVRVWTLQYILLREGIAQHSEEFDYPTDDRASYLRSLHHALGLRGYCKHSNKIFLKLLKSELMTMATKDDYSADMAQVLFDLHQLKFAAGIGDWDHDCPPEPLDKKSATYILETVVLSARRMNIKDLLKSELKGTIDKIQQALGPPRSAPVLSYNKRVINAYLKSPINQLQLFRASRGEASLQVRLVDIESSKIAAHGWYFLVGSLALAKFKSIKRTNPGPTDDLDVAITFFRYDLEHDFEKWETWFRLAQVYDAKIEEDLLSSADKVNNSRPELAALQRNAIHCYEMAMAMSVRTADDTAETANLISQMYTGFATRLYASSREPLTMDAFDTKYQQRHFTSSNEHSGVYEGPSMPSMPVFTIWRFSAHLLRRALIDKPQNWMNHYLLGKCLWKMLTNPDPRSSRSVLVEEVLEAFSEAIENLPGRKDNRSDHILEPHFKLVSIVHKLVHRKLLTPVQGSDALQVTPWARNVHLAEDEDSWEPYVLEILKNIGHADKSNWHHRIIARAAHVIYDDQQNIAGALGAKHEFTQQIFTKTMTLQVWKPENERAGRHYVYTSRYVLFFVSLLNQLNDRASLDQLVRRIRRKPGDYLNHQQVWEHIVTTYVGLLRRMAKVPHGYEEGVFRTMDHDEFQLNARKLELYAHDPGTSNLVLDILRDAIELKKLNNSLMKGSLIDDLIVDCYAFVYQGYVATLPEKERTESKIITLDQPQHGNRERMKLGSILTSQADGNTESKPDAQPTRSTQSIAHSTLTTPNLTSSGVPAPSSKQTRPKTVTRREVQRKAEGLIVRPPPIKTPTLLKNTTFSRPFIAVEIPRSSQHVRSSSVTDTQTAAVGLGLGLVEGSRVVEVMRQNGEDGAPSAESSRPGSVHDSADDESELSELEEVDRALEDVEVRPEVEKHPLKPEFLFPSLVREESTTNDELSVVISDSESARMDVDDRSEKGENSQDRINDVREDSMKE